MSKPKVIVVGAGSFGVWTAYQLLQKGIDVHLFDAWGPGHARASSGGETRVIRSVYGDDEIYVKLVAESLKLWRHYDQAWQTQLYVETGNLWLISGEDDRYLKLALPHLQKAKLDIENLTLKRAKAAYPQINFSDISSVYLEKEAGLLNARQACQEVCRRFVAAGGHYQQAKVAPGILQNGRLSQLRLSNQSQVQADQYIFACGPWLPKLFPALLAPQLEISRQEVYYFGTPMGQQDFQFPKLPVWIDFGSDIYYGIPDHQHRGFKLADDTRRSSIDPDTIDRMPNPDRLATARRYLQHRFPALKNAPLLESRVCQYTNTTDGHFLIDRHPEASNVWIAGAGCGHGFKMGPAIGKYISNLITEERTIEPFFRLNKNRARPTQASQFKAHRS